MRGFRTLQNIDIECHFARKGRIGWQVLLGENGCGKSSLLQAVALALGGDENFGDCHLPAADLLSRGDSGRTTTANVRIWLSTLDEPIEFVITEAGCAYAGADHGADMFVRAYGPTRLLPHPRHPQRALSKENRRFISNLFDPFCPLTDVQNWLAGLTDEEFDQAAITLKTVLRLPRSGMYLERVGDEIVAVEGKRRFPLALLSHGQQSAIVLATDLMAGLMQNQRTNQSAGSPLNFQEAAGIVLLDEIDAHLHPQWKMTIVSSLREAFPRIQFLASTHEPLCLRGLQEHEIVIMTRDEHGEVRARVCDISPQGWRVDQILTSELFGLHSTIDPEIDEDFQRYYALLSRAEQLTPTERAVLNTLKVKLHSQNRLGPTRRDQLVYEIVDEFLAKEPLLPEGGRRQLLDTTRRKVADLWNWVQSSPEFTPDAPR